MPMFLITALGIVVADRAIPLGTWLFGVMSYKTTLKQLFSQYKLVSFPRTLLAALVCIPDFVSMFWRVNKDTLDLIVLGAYLLFGASALFDAMRAIRVGGYRKGIWGRQSHD